MEFGKRLRRARQQANLTQDAVAVSCGTTRSAVSQWESGLTLPSLESFIALLERIGTPADVLLLGKGIAAISKDEQILLTIYRALPDDWRHALVAHARAQLELAAGKNVTPIQKDG